MYKIGDIAQLAHVSKRTVDYYTQLGLIEAKRSESNHRYYTEDTVNDIQLITKYKEQHLTLDEIKQKMNFKRSIRDETIFDSIETLINHMEKLDEDFLKLQALKKQLNDSQMKYLNEKVAKNGRSLLKSWERLLETMT